MHTDTWSTGRRALDPLDLEIHVVKNDHMRVLGMELDTPARAVYALNYLVISPGHLLQILVLLLLLF